MAAKDPSPKLIEATLTDIRGLIENVESRRAELDAQLEGLRQRYREWEQVLSGAKSNGTKRPRAKKGENDAKIAQVFDQNPGRGFTLPELADRTGVSWSSVRNAVSKNGKGRYHEQGGKWYRVEDETNLNV
jgi:DNA-binding GntR family transcriptional regulator